MRQSLLVVTALALLLTCASGAALAGAVFLGPGPGLTGNDTGGIIAYTPDLERGVYRKMAANWCARWDRLSHVTSVHRKYGDYIGFVCIDRPGMIH
jgi:hypothetical protein